jgi:hypothetical protein
MTACLLVSLYLMAFAALRLGFISTVLNRAVVDALIMGIVLEVRCCGCAGKLSAFRAERVRFGRTACRS